MKSTNKISTQPKTKKQYWAEHIDCWLNSPLTQEQYCAQEQISFSSFAYWRTLLNKETRPEKQIKANPPSNMFKAAILKSPPVPKVAEPLHTIVVTLPNKIQVSMPSRIKQTELTTILQALGALV